MSGHGPKECSLPLVSVIVPTYKRINSLMRNLNSLICSNYRNIEIIVVDMGNNFEEIQKIISDEIKNSRDRDINIMVTNSPAELYVSGAIEKGLKFANGEFILICADDVVLERETIQTLVKIMLSYPKIGILAPLCYYFSDKNRLWWGGTKFNLAIGRTYVYGRDLELPRDLLFESDAFTTIALIRKKIFLENLENDGFMYVNPEEFPIHMEEADFCFRAKRRGWRIVVTSLAKAYHDVPLPSNRTLSRLLHITNPMRAYYVGRNRILFVRKYGTAFQRILFLGMFNWVMTGIYLLAILFSKNSPDAKLKMVFNFLRGTFDGITYKFTCESLNERIKSSDDGR